MPRVGTVLASALVTAALLAGCGDDEDETVDAAQIEQEIELRLSSGATEVSSVSCPDDVKSETGAKFTCSAKIDGGGAGKVQVTQTGEDEFTYGFKPGTVQLAGATVDKRLEQELAAS